jgi:hypothetical protein
VEQYANSTQQIAAPVFLEIGCKGTKTLGQHALLLDAILAVAGADLEAYQLKSLRNTTIPTLTRRIVQTVKNKRPQLSRTLCIKSRFMA